MSLVRAKQPDTPDCTTMSDSSTVSELEEPPSSDSPQGGKSRVQNGHPNRVPLAVPSSGGHAEHAAADTVSPPPPPLPSTQPGGPSLQAGDPPRAAPRQCEDQEAHFCLHSVAPSDQSGGSIGRQRHYSGGPGPTGAVPRLPPAVSQQPCHVGRWVQASDPGRPGPASPMAAEEELPPHYAGSVTSSINSRHGLSVASMLRKLNKCISNMQNTEDMGEKIIAYKQKEMSGVADKIRAKVDAGEELEPGFMAEIEEALDTADLLAENAIIRLDKLATEKEEAKALVSARPKLAFKVFTGDVSQYPTFLANQEQLYEMFYDENAPDKGASQQLFQLSKILAPNLARTVLSYSGSKNSAQKAADWLALKFDPPQLMVPVINQVVAQLIGDHKQECQRPGAPANTIKILGEGCQQCFTEPSRGGAQVLGFTDTERQH